jgi:hypothetical protein
MKRLPALCVVLALCLGTVMLADEKMDKSGGKAMRGTIATVDNDQKMMTVRSKSGKEWTIYWNDDTKVEGSAPKEGAMVWFKATEKDRKMWATWIKTGEDKGKM